MRSVATRVFLFLSLIPSLVQGSTLPSDRLVAHAGGAYHGDTYTNTQEALNWNYSKGFRYFEIDFQWTADGHLVPFHDWDQTFPRLFDRPWSYAIRPYLPGFIRRWFKIEEHPAPTLAEYVHFKMLHGYHQLTLESLFNWMDIHPDVFIVTDVKTDPIEGLKILAQRRPDLRDRFIPQIYQLYEYEPTRALGFENIILTLYLAHASHKDILAFSQNNPLFAVTMHYDLALNYDLPKGLVKAGVFIYAHTVNKKEMVDQLIARGVHGIYTDEIDVTVASQISWPESNRVQHRKVR